MDIQDKVALIREEILEDVQNEIDEKIEKETEKLEEDYKQFKNDLQKRKKKIIDSYKHKAESKKEQIISKGVLENKKKKIQKKQNLFDQLLNSLREKLIEYRNEEEYYKFLKSLISEALENINSKKVNLSFNKKDKEIYSQKIKDEINEEFSEYEISIDEENKDIDGGVIVETQNGREIIFNTFEVLIENIEEDISKQFQKEIVQSKSTKNR